MTYYWCEKYSDTYEEVSKERADELVKQGEFVTTSLATAVFYLCG